MSCFLTWLACQWTGSSRLARRCVSWPGYGQLRRPALDAACCHGGSTARYQRRLGDATAAGQEVLIHLQVRRFFCGNQGCAKVTFAEQVPGLTTRYGRRTSGLDQMLQAIALALGGRAGSRLAGRLACAVSRSTLLRLIRALPDPPTGQVTVLGVDLSRSGDYPDC